MNIYTWVAVIFAGILIGLFLILNRLGKRLPSAKSLPAFGQLPENPKYPLSGISAYERHARVNCNESGRIDDTTWSDLDMDKVFRQINLCLSSPGEEYLYFLLRHSLLEPSSLSGRQSLADELSQDPQVRETIRRTLFGLGKKADNGLPDYLFNARMMRLKNAVAYKIMAVLPIVCLLLMFFSLRLGVVALAASLAANAITYFRQKLRLEAELGTIRYLSSLLWCAQSLAGHNVRGCGYFDEMRKALPYLKAIRGRMSSMTRQRAGDLESFADFFKMLFLWDLLRYDHIVSVISGRSEELFTIYRNVAQIDIACGISSLRYGTEEWCRPDFRTENEIVFEDAYHPLLPQSVRNSGKISNDSLITGSNASGKSTFIKMLAVNALLATAIDTCCARQFRLPRALVMTSMALRDNIVAGESYFVAEIKSIRRIVERAASMPCLCFIDEILRGTNTQERIASSIAVLNHLHGKRGCLCIVATHDIELSCALKGSFDNYHFRERLEQGAIVFDYKLQNGPSSTKNAILLLESMGFDEKIVNEAKEIYSTF